jgi:hypothetical protein
LVEVAETNPISTSFVDFMEKGKVVKIERIMCNNFSRQYPHQERRRRGVKERPLASQISISMEGIGREIEYYPT